jgi:hypothetical protein
MQFEGNATLGRPAHIDIGPAPRMAVAAHLTKPSEIAGVEATQDFALLYVGKQLPAEYDASAAAGWETAEDAALQQVGRLKPQMAIFEDSAEDSMRSHVPDARVVVRTATAAVAAEVVHSPLVAAGRRHWHRDYVFSLNVELPPGSSGSPVFALDQDRVLAVGMVIQAADGATYCLSFASPCWTPAGKCIHYWHCLVRALSTRPVCREVGYSPTKIAQYASELTRHLDNNDCYMVCESDVQLRAVLACQCEPARRHALLAGDSRRTFFDKYDFVHRLRM